MLPIPHAADQCLHLGMIDAHDRKAVEGDVLDEGKIGLAGRIEGAVMVEMLRIDVGDDHHIRRQLDEGTVGLIGFNDHPVAACRAGHSCHRH